MTAQRYDRVARLLHWLIGALLLAQIAFGFLLDDIAPRNTPARANVINLHKSLGMVLGLLILARLLWRLTHRPPPWLPSLPQWQQRAAHWGHVLLYVCMVTMPLSGYVASNFSKHGVKFFGTPLAPWGPELPEVYKFFNGVHVVTAFVFTALIVGHVLAAISHLIARDGTLHRISWPPTPKATTDEKTILVSLLALPLLAAAAPFAYVPNEGSGTLSVIDTATDKVVAEISAGKKPRGTVVGIDGKTAYVSDQPNNRLVVIDLDKRAQSGSIALGESPEGVGISADGKWIAVAIEESNDVVFVDATTNQKAFAVQVKGKNPEHAMFSPDGTLVFVSAEEGEAVDIIDFAKRVEVKQIPVGARPRGIGFSPDGKRAYVAAENASEVYVIDTVNFAIQAKLKAGPRSNGIAVHPDGKRVFVSNGGDATVSVLDTSSNTIVATIGVGQRPWNMALTPDGKKLYVACGRSGAVSVIDTEKNVKIADVPVGKLPWGVAIR